jgi:hypothetical protein
MYGCLDPEHPQVPLGVENQSPKALCRDEPPAKTQSIVAVFLLYLKFWGFFSFSVRPSSAGIKIYPFPAQA